MTYELRPGIVFTKVCGEYLLIPTRQASESCPMLKCLNLISAAMIENIIKREPIEKTYRIYEILSRKTPEEAKERIDQMIQVLFQEGFLIEKPEEEAHDAD